MKPLKECVTLPSLGQVVQHDDDDEEDDDDDDDDFVTSLLKTPVTFPGSCLCFSCSATSLFSHGDCLDGKAWETNRRPRKDRRVKCQEIREKVHRRRL